MNLKVTPVFGKLWDGYQKGFRVFVLEGGSRSSKSWSICDFINLVSKQHQGQAKPITFSRKNYTTVEETVYKTFQKNLMQHGLWDYTRLRMKPLKYNLWGNPVSFIGLDDPQKVHGREQWILWIDEAIEVSRAIFDQLEQRTEFMVILSFNPSNADSFIFKNVLTRPDVCYIHSTFRDNPFVPEMEKRKILSYCPYNFEDEHLPEDQRRPHPTNIEDGTADPFMWSVYGMGLKAKLKGRIYPDLYEYSTLPEGARFLGYSGDWGFNHPTVVVALYAYGNNLYVREVIHAPGMDYNDIYRKMIADGCKDRTDDCVFDSEDPRGIQALKRMGLRIWRAYKKQGWVMHTIKTMRGLKIHIHTGSASVRKDFENYCWKWDDLTDKPLDVPMETGKDSCDAVGYGVIRFISRIEAE